MSTALAVRPSTALTTQLYDTMCRAIIAAHDIDEVKDIRDRAVAFEHYSQQARNHEAEDKARAIRIRAERRCGEMLAHQPKAKGSPGNQHTGPVVRPDGSKTLADHGITRDQSSNWQKLAAVPEPEFEEAMADPAGTPTTTRIIERHEAKSRAPAPQDKVDKDALWLWGVLRDIDNTGLLDREPREIMKTMLDHMKQTTLEVAPRVAAWLEMFR